MRVCRFLIVLMVLAAAPVMAQQTMDRPLIDPQPYFSDSGSLANPLGAARTVYTEKISIDGTGWLRVYFADEVALPEGSFLRITSELDGEVQELDAAALAMWSNSTAYFNGDSVRVELVAGPGTEGNRLVTDKVAFEAGSAPPPGECGYCGADNRVPSSETFAARLLPAGCSATVFNSDSCMVSAGHCVSGGMVMQFNVPPSTAGCGIVNPPVADQFPAGTFLFSNGGVGADWSVITMGTNNLGQKPFDRYGESRPIATSPPSVGNPLTIWGYGVDPDQCTQNQVQQTSSGSVSSVSGTFFNHIVDATFGNSGSAVMRNGQEILGINTHCPCPNWATRVDHPSFVSARDSLCPTASAQSASLISVNVPVGTISAGNLGELIFADGQYLEVDSVPLGTVRHAMLAEVFLQSPLSTVSELNVRVEVGPAAVSPIFVATALFDYDTGSYVTQSFDVVSTSTNVVIELNAVPSANAFVSPTGEVTVRVTEVSRQVQTPDGFTANLDLVEATVVP